MTSPEAKAPLFPARGLSMVYVMGEVDVRALREVDLDVAGGDEVVLYPADAVTDGARSIRLPPAS